MSVVDLQELEEVKGLLLKGQQVGVLTFAEIATAVAEIDLDEADVEELHGYLEKSEIELVEEVDPALEAAREERPRILGTVFDEGLTEVVDSGHALSRLTHWVVLPDSGQVAGGSLR